MCNSTSLRPLYPVKPEAWSGTLKCKALANSTTFVLTDSVTNNVVTLDYLKPAQVSSLILAFRQGSFCGHTGEELAFLLGTYGDLVLDREPYNLF